MQVEPSAGARSGGEAPAHFTGTPASRRDAPPPSDRLHGAAAARLPVTCDAERSGRRPAASRPAASPSARATAGRPRHGTGPVRSRPVATTAAVTAAAAEKPRAAAAPNPERPRAAGAAVLLEHFLGARPPLRGPALEREPAPREIAVHHLVDGVIFVVGLRQPLDEVQAALLVVLRRSEHGGLLAGSSSAARPRRCRSWRPRAPRACGRSGCGPP